MRLDDEQTSEMMVRMKGKSRCVRSDEDLGSCAKWKRDCVKKKKVGPCIGLGRRTIAVERELSRVERSGKLSGNPGKIGSC